MADVLKDCPSDRTPRTTRGCEANESEVPAIFTTGGIGRILGSGRLSDDASGSALADSFDLVHARAEEKTACQSVEASFQPAESSTSKALCSL